MSLRDIDHGAVRSWLAGLETKAAPMVFPAMAGGLSNGGSWGDGWAAMLSPHLPGAHYPYAMEAGDLWRNSVVGIALGWMADNFAEPMAQVLLNPRGKEPRAQPNHALLSLLDEPNPDYDGDALWAATIVSYCVSGNAYWLKAKAPSRKKMFLYYVPHWEIEPRWDVSGKTFITHYEHVVDGKRIRLEKEDVVHFRHGLDLRNVRSGLPQLEPLLREICTDNQGATFTAALLRNAGVPGVILAPEDNGVTIEEDEGNRLKLLYKERTSGENVGGALVTSLRLKISQLGFSPEQLALDKIRQIPEARICAALKIPAMVLGLSIGDSQRTYANMAVAERMAYRNCLVPLQKSMAKTVSRQLLPDVGGLPNEAFGWNYTNVQAMAEEAASLTKRIVATFAGGLIKRNEGRVKLGYEADPGPEGDQYAVAIKAPADSKPTPEESTGDE